MTRSTTQFDSNSHSQVFGELNADRRERVAREQAQMRERRQEELQEQSSMLRTPAERVQIWERLHSLTLPRLPDHPLVRVVALGTGLTVQQIRDEQKRRITPIA